MNKKQIRKLAQQIAEQERIIAASTDQDEIRTAQDKLMILCKKTGSLEDMMLVDDMVQEILNS